MKVILNQTAFHCVWHVCVRRDDYEINKQLLVMIAQVSEKKDHTTTLVFLKICSPNENNTSSFGFGNTLTIL